MDDETAREIEKLVRDLDRKLQIEHTGDVFPSQNATIIKGQTNHLAAEQMKWGFLGFEKGKLLINARAESALERKTAYSIGGVSSRRRDSMSGIKVRKSSPMNAKMHRFFSWPAAITGIKVKKGL